MQAADSRRLYPLGELSSPPFSFCKHVACLQLPGIVKLYRLLILSLHTLLAFLQCGPGASARARDHTPAPWQIAGLCKPQTAITRMQRTTGCERKLIVCKLHDFCNDLALAAFLFSKSHADGIRNTRRSQAHFCLKTSAGSCAFLSKSDLNFCTHVGGQGTFSCTTGAVDQATLCTLHDQSIIAELYSVVIMSIICCAFRLAEAILLT